MVAADKVGRRLLDVRRDSDVRRGLRVLRDHCVAVAESEGTHLIGCRRGRHVFRTGTDRLVVVDVCVVAEPDRDLTLDGVLIDVADARRCHPAEFDDLAHTPNPFIQPWI